MEVLLLQHYTTHFLHHIHATGHFKLLQYWFKDIQTYVFIVILWICPVRSICCSSTNNMATRDPVGSMRWKSNFGSGGEYRPKFIYCVDRKQPQIHEIWTFREYGVTHEVFLTAQVYVGAGFVSEFSTNDLTTSWRRVPMFGTNSINGSFDWLGIYDFLWNDGLPWALNILAPYASWGYRGSIINQNWGSGYGGNYGSVSVLSNRPTCVLLI